MDALETMSIPIAAAYGYRSKKQGDSTRTALTKSLIVGSVLGGVRSIHSRKNLYKHMEDVGADKYMTQKQVKKNPLAASGILMANQGLGAAIFTGLGRVFTKKDKK